MGESARPTFQSVRRSLLIGILVGIIFGCSLGTALGLYYGWQVNPATYAGGAFPTDLTANYQGHYVAMVVDSYIVNRQVNVAQERLKTLDNATVIRALGERSAAFVANGQAVESQLVNELALNLKNSVGWDDDTIKGAIGELSTKYQQDDARAQAINTFSAQLLEGQIPVPPEAGQVAPAAEPAAGGGLSGLWRILLACFVVIIALVIAVLLAGRWQLSRKKAQPRPQIAWEGEGPAPIKVWTGTYTLGQNNYDEFFTVETPDGDFLGESGMGIMKAIPGTNPKQVTAFDVGLFDKTDITTLSRVVMSEHAYRNDEDLRTTIEANPQAEGILAEPGHEFTLETSALRVVAKIDELEYGEGNVYFDKLKVTLQVFLQEGADLKIGTMDVPEEYRL